MFKVTDGLTEEVAPLFGNRLSDRDGDQKDVVDKAVEVPDRKKVKGRSDTKALNPNGY